jgi:hypothetical protein
MNARWHERNPMPRPATLEQRVSWHVAHAAACGCRPIPATLVTELKRRGRSVSRRFASVRRNSHG